MKNNKKNIYFNSIYPYFNLTCEVCGESFRVYGYSKRELKDALNDPNDHDIRWCGDC